MTCSNLLRKIDIKVSDLESKLNNAQKENETIKRVVGSLINEWERTGVIDIDVLKKVVGK